ncbi:MAG: hypothetical protein ACYTHJ_17935 [Planctomycetota bacterium]
MLAVLGSLVFAMTGTSTLLSWLDPSLPPAMDELPSETIIELAQSAVSGEVSVDGTRWERIEVIVSAYQRTNPMLSAPSREAGWHFRISADGRPTVGRTWRLQEDAGAANVILVNVIVQDGSDSITSSQAICVRALLASIYRELGAGVDVPIVSRLPGGVLG